MRGRRWITIIATGVLVASLAAGIYWRQVVVPERARAVDSALADGISLFEDKQYAESLETLNTIPIAWSDDWRFPYYRGSARLMLNDHRGAARELELALAMDPAQTAVLYSLGVTYYKLGKLSLAKGYFASVLEINPGDEQAKGLMDIMDRLEREQPQDAPESD